MHLLIWLSILIAVYVVGFFVVYAAYAAHAKKNPTDEGSYFFIPKYKVIPFQYRRIFCLGVLWFILLTFVFLAVPNFVFGIGPNGNGEVVNAKVINYSYRGNFNKTHEFLVVTGDRNEGVTFKLSTNNEELAKKLMEDKDLKFNIKYENWITSLDWEGKSGHIIESITIADPEQSDEVVIEVK